jgi:hypothetical protein
MGSIVWDWMVQCSHDDARDLPLRGSVPWNDGATRHAILGLRHYRSGPGLLDQFTRAILRQPRGKLANAASSAASMG